MSPRTDIGKGRGADDGARSGLLVVLEPASSEEVPGAPEGLTPPAPAAILPGARAALVSEATRLALELSVEARYVTWSPRPEASSEAIAAAVADVGRSGRPVALLFADTDLGRELAPMVAHGLGSGVVVGCTDVLVQGGRLGFVRPVYGGWLEQDVEAAEGFIPVVTLDLTGIPESESPPEGLPAPEVLAVKSGPVTLVRSLGLVPPDPETVDLAYAKRIVAAGSGSASEPLLTAVRELADLLDGSLGATRPVVDDGRVPKARLIGQTGRTVTPDLYVALGISGSPHHVAGVKKAGTFLSINRDARAPIFQFSDVGYVADLEVVLPALVEKIKEYRDDVRSPR